ncbi:unnamed protein product [Pylaiella littoralis]
MEPPGSALRALPTVSAKVPSTPEDVHLVRVAKDSVPPTATPVAPPIIACITAYNESHEELQYCLGTFHGRCPADVNLDSIYVILDGCPDEDMQAGNQTFQALVSTMGLHLPNGGTRFIHEGGCRVYLGKVGSVPVRLYVKGRGDFQSSKRRSIIALYDILGERIASGRIEEPLAILHMDADTGSAEPGGDNSVSSFGLENVAKLVRIMQANDNLGALAAQVRVLHRTRNALALMQSFDCNAIFVGFNGGTSLVGLCVSCMGMTVMYRYRALHISSVKGVPSPMSAFSRAADRNIVDHVNLDMNEDQGMTTFIMRAGYDTKTCLVTRFYTFAPQDLAELLGQRRRWQAGFFVGLPSQVFGSPSPHFQLSKFRWLSAYLVMSTYLNMLFTPGTLGFGLACMFEEASMGLINLIDGVKPDSADGGDRLQMPEEMPGTFRRQAIFLSCLWAVWLSFIVSTMGQAPKKIRIRCQVFFGLACAMTIAVVVAAALLSRAGQVFLGIMVGWNVVQGVFLTYDVREWPHRLQEVLPYCAYYCAIQPMITMYAVANIDSALWGTRSIGEVKNALTSISPSDTNPAADMDQADHVTTTCRTGCSDGSDGIRKRVLSCLRGEERSAPLKSDVTSINEDASVPLLRDAPDDAAVGSCNGTVGMRDFGVSGCGREADGAEKHPQSRCGEEGGEERDREKRSSLSLRAWKFVLLALWVLFNMCVTATFLHWRLETVAELAFFSQLPSLMIFVLAAWVEMQFQRRSALPPPPSAGTLDGGCVCGARSGIRSPPPSHAVVVIRLTESLIGFEISGYR